MAESLEALRTRTHKRDLAVYRFYGAMQAISESPVEQYVPGHIVRELRRYVAECRAELAQLEAPAGAYAELIA